MSSLSGKNIGEISSLYESMYSSVEDEKEVSLKEFSTEELLDMYAEEIREQLVSELEEHLKEEIKSENIEEKYGIGLLRDIGRKFGIGNAPGYHQSIFRPGYSGRPYGTIRKVTTAGAAGMGLNTPVGKEILDRTGAALGAAGREFANPGSTTKTKPEGEFSHITGYDNIPSGHTYWDSKKGTYVTKP